MAARRLSEGRDWLERALNGKQDHPRLRIVAHYGASGFAHSQGHSIAAPSLAEGCLALAQLDGDPLDLRASEDTAGEDGMPVYGTSFITQGYLYPAGTLTESNGVLPDGSPEFPDKVIGQWTCRGWFIGEGMATTTGPMVVTTQIYNLGGEYRLGGEFGGATIITEGYELADVGVMVQRAITGGTGDYAGARGEQRQTLLGVNAAEGFNLQIEIAVVNE